MDIKTIEVISTIAASVIASFTGVFLISPKIAKLRAETNTEKTTALIEANESTAKQINQLDKRIASMFKSISERDVIIDNLTRNVRELNGQILSLQVSVSSRDEKIRKLIGDNNELKEKYRVTNDLLTAHIETIKIMEEKLALAEDWKMGVEILTSQVIGLNQTPRYRPK